MRPRAPAGWVPLALLPVGICAGCALAFPFGEDLTGNEADAESDGGAFGDDFIDDVTSPTEPDAGPDGSWCARLVPAPTFCDDFDEDPVAVGWSGATTTRGTLTLDPSLSTSAPNSLDAVIVAKGDGGYPMAILQKRFATLPQDLHFAFDMNVAAPAPAGCSVADVELATGYTLSITIANAAGSVQGQAVEVTSIDGGVAYVYDHFVDTFATSTWLHFDVDMTFLPSADGGIPSVGVGAGALHITMNGASEVGSSITPQFGGAGATLTIGVQEFGGSDACEIHVDNVTVNTTSF